MALSVFYAHQEVDVEVASRNKGSRVQDQAVVDEWTSEPGEPLDQGLLEEIWTGAKEVADVGLYCFCGLSEIHTKIVSR